MIETQEKSTVTKVRHLNDIKVVLDYPRWTVNPDYPLASETHEQFMARKEKSLNYWAAEINEFIRDHRSRDAEQVSIDREYIDVCSACGAAWEPYYQTGEPITCANCGEAVQA